MLQSAAAGTELRLCVRGIPPVPVVSWPNREPSDSSFFINTRHDVIDDLLLPNHVNFYGFFVPPTKYSTEATTILQRGGRDYSKLFKLLIMPKSYGI